MSSLVAFFAPDLDTQVGNIPEVQQQIMNIMKVLDAQGTLPPPFVSLTPDVHGHGEAWQHPGTGLFVVRADHRPVLLTNSRCATCRMEHMDVCHGYVFCSPQDWANGAYVRYTGAPVVVAGSAPIEPGLDSGGTVVTSEAATETSRNGNG